MCEFNIYIYTHNIIYLKHRLTLAALQAGKLSPDIISVNRLKPCYFANNKIDGEWMFLPHSYGIMFLTHPHLMTKVAKLLLLNTPWHTSCNDRVEKNLNPGNSRVALTSHDFLSSGQPQQPLHCPLFSCAMYRNERHQPEQNEGDLGGCMSQVRFFSSGISSKQPRSDPTAASRFKIH